MLDRHHREEVLTLLRELECRVVLPDGWDGRFFEESGVSPTTHDERRGFVRHHYRTKAILCIEQSLPAIRRDPETAVVYARDISRNGIGFLHAAQLFPGESARLMLTTHAATIRVASCRKLSTHCYLIGARFRSET